MTSNSTPVPVSEDEARISAALAQDRPTIDGAVKSFLSLICARGLTAATEPTNSSSTINSAVSVFPPIGATAYGNSNKEALQVARAILQACNSYRFPVHQTVASVFAEKPGLSAQEKKQFVELSVVARLWNGLIESKQKPTKFLGRKALLHNWTDLKNDVASRLLKDGDKEEKQDDDGSDDSSAEEKQMQQLAWVQEFEKLLFQYQPPSTTTAVVPATTTTATTVQENDNDSPLVWAADGGEAELARRRQRRKSAATERGPVTPS